MWSKSPGAIFVYTEIQIKTVKRHPCLIAVTTLKYIWIAFIWLNINSYSKSIKLTNSSSLHTSILTWAEPLLQIISIKSMHQVSFNAQKCILSQGGCLQFKEVDKTAVPFEWRNDSERLLFTSVRKGYNKG